MGKTVRRAKQDFGDDYDPKYSPTPKRKRDEVRPFIYRKTLSNKKREIDDWVPKDEGR